MKRIAILVSLFFCVCGLSAQDLITRNDGTQIYCRILKVDSSSITYKTPQVRDEQTISRTLVQNYYQSTSAARAPVETNKKDEEAPEVFLLKFRLGSSKPLAEFARMDANDEKAGLAMSGLAGEVTAIVKLHKLIGISFAYKFQNNPFNVDVICEELRTQVPNATFTGNSEAWKMRGLFAGLHFSLPLPQPEGLWITADVGGGFPKFVFPDITITGNFSGSQITVHQSAEIISSPAINAGLGIRYKFSKNVGLDLNVDFYRARPTFRVVTSNSAGLYDSSSYEQIVRTVNICAGLTFCFLKSK